MEEINIELRIDYKESIDVKAFTNLLDSVNKLCIYRAHRDEEDDYRLQEVFGGIIPKGLEIKEIKQGSVVLNFILASIVSGLVYDGAKFLIKKAYAYYKNRRNSPQIREIDIDDICDLIHYLDAEEIYQIRNLCKQIIFSNIEFVHFRVNDTFVLKIDKAAASLILNYSRHDVLGVKYVYRKLNNVPMRIMRDGNGRFKGAINSNKTSHPLFFANETIKNAIMRMCDYNYYSSSIFYVEVADVRINGKLNDMK